MKNKFKKGSSIAELLAVIIIMGIIAAIAVPTVGGLLKNSREKAAVEDVKSIVSTMTTFASTEQFSGVIEFHGSEDLYSKETSSDNVETENIFCDYIEENAPDAVSGLNGIIYVTYVNGVFDSIVCQSDLNGVLYSVNNRNYSFTGTSLSELKAKEIWLNKYKD